jgi:cell division protein FtsB
LLQQIGKLDVLQKRKSGQRLRIKVLQKRTKSLKMEMKRITDGMDAEAKNFEG